MHIINRMESRTTVAIDFDHVDAIGEALIGQGPVTMLNLLRYRDQAAYPADSGFSPCSGRDAYYLRYASVAQQRVASFGGHVIWFGHPVASLIGPADERWDDVILVGYSDYADFLKLMNDAEYRTVVIHRTAALTDSRLVAMKQATLPA